MLIFFGNDCSCPQGAPEPTKIIAPHSCFKSKSQKWSTKSTTSNVLQQNLKWLSTVSSSSSFLIPCHVWGQSCDHPWHSPGGLPASTSQPSGGGKWKGKEVRRHTGWRLRRHFTHSHTKNARLVLFLKCASYSLCSSWRNALSDHLWLKIKRFQRVGAGVRVGPKHCLKFCDLFLWPVSVGRSQKSSFVNRVQQLFTAERLLMISDSLSKCWADPTSITVRIQCC